MNTTSPSPLLPLVTSREAATIARCSVRTIDRAIGRGDLRAGGTPGRRLIRFDELRRWLNVDG